MRNEDKEYIRKCLEEADRDVKRRLSDPVLQAEFERQQSVNSARVVAYVVKIELGCRFYRAN